MKKLQAQKLSQNFEVVPEATTSSTSNGEATKKPRYPQTVLSNDVFYNEFLGRTVALPMWKLIVRCIDPQNNGYLSYEQFICACVIFKKGSKEEKFACVLCGFKNFAHLDLVLERVFELCGKGRLSRRKFMRLMKNLFETSENTRNDAFSQAKHLVCACFPDAVHGRSLDLLSNNSRKLIIYPLNSFSNGHHTVVMENL